MTKLLLPWQVNKVQCPPSLVPTSRFLEYTSAVISSQLQGLSIEARDCIKSWPCVLMQEGRGQEKAYVAQVTGVELAGVQVKLTVASLPGRSAILNDDLWKLRSDLDIEQFEFNRNHFAIKDRDLFSLLAASGHPFDTAAVSRFQNKPLPVPPRLALIRAIDVISRWSHSDIDRFLLEAGVSDLSAGHDVGGRQARAQAIVEFAIKNPSTTTVENSLFSAFVMKRVESPSEESSTRIPNRVFVVHGQNKSAKKAIVSFLSRVGLEGIVLHQQPNMGRHLLTKFIEEAELTTFAIVLMTDDDVGCRKGGSPAPRARQNVILELGYFLAHFGQSRVCALITPDLETPSDFDGIAYIRMDESDQWKTELTRELKAARMPLIKDPTNG